MKADPHGGWRRVVPSPTPYSIVETPVIERLVADGTIVIASGGGGIPVIEKGPRLIGKEGVVDKDLASAILAHEVAASVLLILTDVKRVQRGFGSLYPEDIDRMTASEAKAMLKKGEFGAGSMGPKVQAAVNFVGVGRRARGHRRPGRRVGRTRRRRGHRSRRGLTRAGRDLQRPGVPGRTRSRGGRRAWPAPRRAAAPGDRVAPRPPPVRARRGHARGARPLVAVPPPREERRAAGRPVAVHVRRARAVPRGAALVPTRRPDRSGDGGRRRRPHGVDALRARRRGACRRRRSRWWTSPPRPTEAP